MKSDWKNCILGDCLQIVKTSVMPKEQTMYSCFSLPAFDNSRTPEILDGKDIKSSKFVLTENTILFNKLNPKFRRIWNVHSLDQTINPIASTEFLPLKVNSNISQDFLYYYISSPSFTALMDGIKTGTSNSQQRIDWRLFLRQPIYLPPSHTQCKIARILTLIDDKIHLNQQINKNLEQQAEAVFKSWFEDFAPFNEPLVETPIGINVPASLKMVQIADIPHVLETGKRPKGGAVTSGIPSIGAENVKQLGKVNLSSAKYIPEEFAAKMKTGAINGYELLLYKDGGKPGTFIPHFSMFGEGFPYQKFFINEHVFKLDFGNRGFNEFAYFFMQTDYAYHWLANNGGKAAVPGINQQNVNDIWIFSPENSKVKEFGEWVQPLFTTILKNCAQNVKLGELRDTLLPKLMSGELDVSTLDF